MSEHSQLAHLQKLRHLSAHPVLTGTDLLFRPTKEDARAQIRVALEAVLLKPALFSKRIVETLVEDIATNKAVFISREKLKAYLEARYLPNMPETIETELFRALWKFCFKLKNTNTEANRKINSDTLAILNSRNPTALRKVVDAERTIFSNVGPEAEPLDALINFLAEYTELHASLDPAAHILIESRMVADINNLVKARFNVDMAEHLDRLNERPAKDIAKLDELLWLSLVMQAEAEAEDELERTVRLAVKVFGSSPSFDAADKRFNIFVEPVLPYFAVLTMTELLEAIDDNAQIYSRGRASFDHPQIRDVAESLGIDTTIYKSFTKSL